MSEQDRERVELDADEQKIERVMKDDTGDDSDDFEGHRMQDYKVEEKVEERAQDV
jgi:hypothetical protein